MLGFREGLPAIWGTGSRGEEVDLCGIWGKSISSRGKKNYQGLKAGARLSFSEKARRVVWLKGRNDGRRGEIEV
jgi:hypothetical protein